MKTQYTTKLASFSPFGGWGATWLAYTLACLLTLACVMSAKAQNYAWAKGITGSTTDDDEGRKTALDASGNVYTTGYFQGTVDSDFEAGTANFVSVGGKDVFVSKLPLPIPSPIRGNMMSFDGVDDAVNCGNVLGFQYTDAFSCEAWVKTTFSTGYPQICSKINPAPAYKGWGWQTENGKVQVYLIEDYPTKTIYTTGNDNIADDNWHHVAFSHLGSGNVNIYVDGMLQINTIVILGTITDITNTANFNIGSYDTPLVGELWQGDIDEVRVWNVARTQAQIRENMHLTLSGAESGLVAYYQFNETTGNAIDAIASNNGVLQNGATRIESTVSVAKGFATRQTVSAAGNQVFGNATINFTAMSAPAANDEFVAYQLYDRPFNNVSAISTASNYWIVRQFGTQTVSYNQMNFTLPASNVISATDVATPSNLKLFKRVHNSGGTWGTEVGTGTSANNTTKVIAYTISPVQTNFSEFIPASVTSPLPITLLGLKGERVEGLNGEKTKEVRLDWSTASEINNKGFEVEVSENAQTYKTIAFVEGKGNSTTVMSYELRVHNTDDAYYRLKQVDFDGKFSYSPLVFVKSIASEVVVYPNPNNGMFTISVSKDKLDLPACLFNAQGIEIPITISPSGSEASIFLSGQRASGVYFLHTVVAGKAKVTKIVIQK